jgi:hypothetical protein
MCTGRGSTRESVGATPFATPSVRQHRIPLTHNSASSNSPPRAVRRNDKIARSGALSTPRSTRGSGDGNVHFASLHQLMLEGCLPPLDEDSNKHYGQRCASPERQFECDGWCRDRMPLQRKTSHADVVGWIKSQLSMRGTHSIGPGRSPSHRPMMVKFLGMGVHPTVAASR